jgi:hypothetical protein
MDNQDVQPLIVKSEKKLSSIQILLGSLGIIVIILTSFLLGKFSESECSKSVLGVQTSDSLISRLAYVFNLNKEGISQQSTYQLAPTSIPTEEPAAEPTNTEDTPSMIWSGLNRNPKPTSTPASNNVITTPEDDSADNSDPSTATPTPKYRTNWDRTIPTPTKTMDEIISEKENKFNDQSDNRKTKPTPILTPKPTPEKIEPAQVKQIIGNVGINIEKPEITTNPEKPGYTINGEIKDKLFGLLPVSYPVIVKINETSGDIENVSVPWWRTLFGNPFVGNISKIRCGDGICSTTENYGNCKADCTPVCGNGICEYGEGQDTCIADCEMIPSPEPIIGQ